VHIDALHSDDQPGPIVRGSIFPLGSGGDMCWLRVTFWVGRQCIFQQEVWCNGRPFAIGRMKMSDFHIDQIAKLKQTIAALEEQQRALGVIPLSFNYPLPRSSVQPQPWAHLFPDSPEINDARSFVETLTTQIDLRHWLLVIQKLIEPSCIYCQRLKPGL
jgi:hypothetical protein